jgi:ribosomal protein L30E
MKADIRKLLGSDKLVMGSDRCMKLLRSGQLKQIMLANNAPVSTVQDVERHAGKTEIVVLDIPNEELGVYCKKPFNISVLGIRQ